MIEIDRHTLKTAVDKYGKEAQLGVMAEECAELIKAILKLTNRRQEDADQGIIEELADVIIMSQQILYVYGEEVVAQEIKKKLTRLRQRLDIPEKNPPGYCETGIEAETEDDDQDETDYEGGIDPADEGTESESRVIWLVDGVPMEDPPWTFKLRLLSSQYFENLSHWEKDFIIGVNGFVARGNENGRQRRKIGQIWIDRVLKGIRARKKYNR